MKNILSTVLIFFTLNTFTQIPQINWQQCYGTNTNDYAFGIVKTESGYMFAIEVFSGDGLTNYHGSYDIWLVNTDSIGTILWEKCYGGSSAESPYKLIKKSEDEFFIFGLAGSTDGDVQSGNHGFADLWVVKINVEGDIIWEKTYGCIGHDNPEI